MSPENVANSWKKFLVPETLRRNLIIASLYLSAYEILIDLIVERVESFYSYDFVDGKRQPSEEYKQQVTALHTKKLQASCLWLQQNNVIDATDIMAIDQIRQHRNEIAHELPTFLSDSTRNISIADFDSIRVLVRKIAVWWVREVDMPCNEDFDGVEVADEDINPGSVLMLEHIISIGMEETGPE